MISKYRYMYLNYVVQHVIASFKRVEGAGKVEGKSSLNLIPNFH